MKILRTPIWLVLLTLLFLGCASIHDKRECIFSETKTAVFWDEQKLDEAFQLACYLGTTTLMVVTNGDIVKSMGELDEPLRVHSVRKALLSALVGQHLGTSSSQINLNSTLAELNINDKPNPLTPLQQQAKVLHLIKSVSGINHEAAAEDGLLKKEKDSGTVSKLYRRRGLRELPRITPLRGMKAPEALTAICGGSRWISNHATSGYPKAVFMHPAFACR
jgi:hypothetical protein